ncbi:MAG TPA: phage head-tail connector protein [Mobilitalea sp.]|nr:phage head-tail connector protein [Mobilitalea sp.]
MDELLSNLKIYLGADYDESKDGNKLSIMLNQALAKVVNKRYPFGSTEAQKTTVLTAYSDVVFDVALFMYNMQGAEGEKSHSENGVNRSYQSIDDLLTGIVPVAKFTSADATVTV